MAVHLSLSFSLHFGSSSSFPSFLHPSTCHLHSNSAFQGPCLLFSLSQHFLFCVLFCISAISYVSASDCIHPSRFNYATKTPENEGTKDVSESFFDLHLISSASFPLNPEFIAMSAPRMYRRRTAWVAAVVVLVLLYHFVSLRSDLDPPKLDTRPKTSPSEDQQRPKAGSGSHEISKAHQEAESKPAERPVCPPLPGMEDVLVVMKTGVTEAKEKVPVHFQTTLRCVPNYVIYSDFDEEIQGVQLHDALRNMDEGIKQSIPDFNIYNRIRTMGRAGLNNADFADVANSALGKPDNPGWKLDKWKFLPMVQETYAHKPDAKWYVFMEADTYFSWGTLLAWLATLNHHDALYIGTETQIADVIFAHGGSGFIVSNPALKRVVDEYAAKPAEIHAYTATHWAGDCVLGKILLNVGVPLTFSWPMLQNSHPGELDEFATVFYRRPWCFPAVAFHHLTPKDVQSLWEFEQKRYKDVRPGPLPCFP